MVLPFPEPNDEERLEELPQDNGTPFGPPDSSTTVTGATDDNQSPGTLSPTHPATDTNIDEQEFYDEGLAGAAEAQDPNVKNAVERYQKPAERSNKGEQRGDKETIGSLLRGMYY